MFFTGHKNVLVLHGSRNVNSKQGLQGCGERVFRWVSSDGGMVGSGVSVLGIFQAMSGRAFNSYY